MEYTANFDGKDYRVTGAPTADAISRVMPKDGKTVRVTISDTTADGNRWRMLLRPVYNLVG